MKDYFEDHENVYLVQSLATKGSLFSYLNKKNLLNEKEAFVYFFQTLLGIDYLHKRGIIHRDLKTENLLFDDSANIRICDFGCVINNKDNKSMKTFCGTFCYMAPELLQGSPYNSKVDIWCQGIQLYEMLHGKFLNCKKRQTSIWIICQ